MMQMLKQRYIVTGIVGQGGMGAVYQAKDTLLGDRLVAIKEMMQRGLAQAEITTASKAFKQEADMLAGLHHPNLPSIHDHFEEGERWYLVMEYIEGRTLDDYQEDRGGKLTIKEVLDIGLQLCAVLDYLHTRPQPIIFRDLKPSNIMLASDGHLYLIDFGIARNFKPEQSKDTHRAYTTGYAAPEQYYNETQTSPQSDIYSMGVTFYQLLTGHRPLANRPTIFDFPPLKLPSPSLATLITQMIENEQNQRPANVAIVKRELQRIATLQTQPPVANSIIKNNQYISTPSVVPGQFVQPPSSSINIQLSGRVIALFAVILLVLAGSLSWLAFTYKSQTLGATPPNASIHPLGSISPVPTPSPIPSPTPSPIPSPTPSPTPSPIPSPTPAPLPPTTYEAESSANVLANGAGIASCSTCSGGEKVGYIGNGGTLQFNNVMASSAGSYILTIYYGTSELRFLYVNVNDIPGIQLTCDNTGGYDIMASQNVTIQLNAGNNTITFYNSQGWAPDIDKIVVSHK